VRKRLKEYNLYNSEILYSPRALGSEKFRDLKDLHLRIEVFPGLSSKDFPSQRFIGVGYRDKGNCRNEAQDGHPSWQECATKEIKTDGKKKGPQVIIVNDHLKDLQNQNWKKLRSRQKLRSVIGVLTFFRVADWK